jgi:mRNA-degrading endonuclease toxin of MazEF toxin-antitoxin module
MPACKRRLPALPVLTDPNVRCAPVLEIRHFGRCAPIFGERKTTGVVLSDQVKSFDWSARNAEFIENRPDVAPEVLGKIRAILGL